MSDAAWRPLPDLSPQDPRLEPLVRARREHASHPSLDRAAALGLEVAPMDGGLLVRAARDPSMGVVRLGLAAQDVRRRCARIRHERLVRAVAAPSGSRVADLAAGFGRDALLLLAAGWEVTLCERDPMIAGLLEGALRAADQAPPAWLRPGAWNLYRGDARSWLEGEHAGAHRVAYLDPMFRIPGRSARPRKELALLAALLGEADPRAEEEGAEVLTRVRAAGPERVVVKRHHGAAPLAPPTFSLPGERVRFDVYLRRP